MRKFAQRACHLEIENGRFHILSIMQIEEDGKTYPVMQLQDVTSQKIVYLEMPDNFLGKQDFSYKLVEAKK